MRVSFYLPPQYMPSVEKQRAWLEGGRVTLEEGGKIATAQSWLFQTWVALRETDCAPAFVHEIPATGIVVTLTGLLPGNFRAPTGLFVAGIVADGLPHPGAHLQIVQNSRHARMLLGSVFMPHWPQPGLLPRDPARGDTLEKVAFFGPPENLAAELRDPRWLEELRRRTGVTLEIHGPDRWHDYSDVDVVLAVRDFSRRRQLHKPAAKLYNAWLAGVPFVGGNDSAYASDGRPGRDYLVARSPDEVLLHLQQMAKNSALRRQLVGRGHESGKKFTPESITARWRTMLADDLPRRANLLAARSETRKSMDELLRRAACLFDRSFKS